MRGRLRLEALVDQLTIFFRPELLLRNKTSLFLLLRNWARFFFMSYSTPLTYCSASEVFAFVTRLFCGYYVTSDLLSRFITFLELAWPDFVFAFN